MVRELGVDAAETQLKEATHVIAPKTDAAKQIDLKVFMREALRPHSRKDSIPVAGARHKERVKLGPGARFGA
jgi:hypothetical protein